MAVGFPSTFGRVARPPGFVSPEDFGTETPTLPGVGAPVPMPTPMQVPDQGSMFEPIEQASTTEQQDQTPEEPWPSADSIDRRRKLAHALMGKQMEVNHPMQAVANAVNQIAGAWMGHKADQDAASLAKRRQEVMKKAVETGDMDAMIETLITSGDEEQVDAGLKMKMQQMAASKNKDAPTTRNFYEGDKVVTKQWDGETGQWVALGEPSSRWRPRVGSGGSGDEVDDNWAANNVASGGGGAPASGPAGAPGGMPAGGEQEQKFKTPGPPGKGGWQKGPEMRGPDGEPVLTVYNPRDANTYYRGKDGLWRFATGGTSGGGLTANQYWKKKAERQDEINGLNAMRDYFKTVKDIPSGINRWANDLSGKVKTFFGQNNLTPAQFNQMSGSAQIVALKGLFRVTIVGPGVMTDQDAAFVMQALGGDPASALQNPAVMADILTRLYDRKRASLKVLDKAVQANAKQHGDEYDPSGVPAVLGGEDDQSSGNRPSAGGMGGPKTVMPPPAQRTKGMEWVNPNGATLVWSGSGWVKKGKN